MRALYPSSRALTAACVVCVCRCVSCVAFQLAADYILDHPDDFLPFLIAGEELPPGGLKKYCDEVTAATSNTLSLFSCYGHIGPAVPNRRWLMTNAAATNQISTQLKRDGVWGGQLELRALAQSLKVRTTSSARSRSRNDSSPPLPLPSSFIIATTTTTTTTG